MAMKFYSETEALDKVIGVKGTAERDEFDGQVNEFLIGEAIRQALQSHRFHKEIIKELLF